tara:strand:+ start:60 stop:896 length:837 start_codon:yes stop_codon:yes gene_type:complete
MKNSILIYTPAKLNLFLRVMGRKKNGYHVIRSGITFINLFDELTVKLSEENKITYTGPFKPKKGSYDDCIILRTLDFLKLNKNVCLDINIRKNIPVKGGLGSASTNAAALINALIKMNLVKKDKLDNYVNLGADIPCLLYQKNCLVTDIGQIITPATYPKYYFLLVMPVFNNSTNDMYNKLGFEIGSFDENSSIENFDIDEMDTGNDFEKIMINKEESFTDVFEFLEKLDNVIFVRMTGSGSCLYAVFNSKTQAIKAQEEFNNNFKELWSSVSENNFN